MKNIFTERDVQYNLRSKNNLQLPNAKTARYRIEDVQYIGHRLWVSLREEVQAEIKIMKRKYLHLQIL